MKDDTMIFDDKYFIGRKIKSFRKKRGLTQAELAEKIDLSEKHISKIEASIHGLFYWILYSFSLLYSVLRSMPNKRAALLLLFPVC